MVYLKRDGYIPKTGYKPITTGPGTAGLAVRITPAYNPSTGLSVLEKNLINPCVVNQF